LEPVIEIARRRRALRRARQLRRFRQQQLARHGFERFEPIHDLAPGDAVELFDRGDDPRRADGGEHRRQELIGDGPERGVVGMGIGRVHGGDDTAAAKSVG
jgi:hypothetical protein